MNIFLLFVGVLLCVSAVFVLQRALMLRDIRKGNLVALKKDEYIVLKKKIVKEEEL